MSSRTAQDRFVSLEDAVRALDGVVGVVVLTGEDGLPEELQVFVEHARPRADVRERVESILADHGAAAGLPRVYVLHTAPGSSARTHVFELTRASSPRSRDMASQPGRVAIQDVDVARSAGTADARVSLRRGDAEDAGRRSGTATEHDLRVTAAAAVDALEHLFGHGRFHVEGAALVEVIGRRVVCVVLVDRVRHGDLVGTCVVGDRPVSEAVVRATLDAANRQLSAPDVDN